nr:sugar ABC transporter permease [Kitasatospora sp. MY 5-36]
MVLVLGLFMVLPIAMALWVSLLHWDGQSNPFSGSADFVGLDNYRRLFTQDGLDRTLFATSLRNTLYYVVLTVPLQTGLALFLAIAVNQRMLRGRGALRTVFYFPSVTSSIAVSTVFLFLFQGSGAVNRMLGWLGVQGPNWFADPRGLVWLVLGWFGVDQPAPTAGGPLGLSWSEWFAGPSVAMSTLILMAVWTTSGTFMLIFLAALQDIPRELEEAAALDGVNRRQLLRARWPSPAPTPCGWTARPRPTAATSPPTPTSPSPPGNGSPSPSPGRPPTSPHPTSRTRPRHSTPPRSSGTTGPTSAPTRAPTAKP